MTMSILLSLKVIASETIGSVPTTNYTVNDVRTAVKTRMGSQITSEKDIVNMTIFQRNIYPFNNLKKAMNSFSQDKTIQTFFMFITLVLIYTMTVVFKFSSHSSNFMSEIFETTRLWFSLMNLLTWINSQVLSKFVYFYHLHVNVKEKI